MGRIRTIKPEFWHHPVMGRLSDEAKTMAIGLLNMADDDGFFFADPLSVRASIRPFDEDSTITRRALDEVSNAGWVEVRNHPTHGPIGRVVNFRKHQRIDRPSPSKIAPYFTDSTSTRRTLTDESTQEQGSGIGSGDRGTDQGSGIILVSESVEGSPPRPGVPFGEILAAWAEICPSLPQPAVPLETRRTRLRKFFERASRDAAAKGQKPMAWVRGFFGIVAESDFLMGRRGRGPGHENFVADLWWVIQPEKYAYILEGRYDNRRTPG